MNGWGGPTECHVHSSQTEFVLSNFLGGRGENATIAALIYYPSVLYLKKVKGRKKQTEGIEKAVQKW